MKLLFQFFLITLCLLHSSTISSSEDVPDFLYLTLQWPGSICNRKQGCCFPKNAKPARDFIITSLQPYYFNGTWPENCHSRNRFSLSKISDLVPRLRRYWSSLTCPAKKIEKIWSREWKKYGTCLESVFDERQYFEAALKLKQKANLLKVLSDAGFHPNGSSYDATSLSDTIIAAGLHMPGVSCNKDKNGNFQLSRIILCSNPNGNSFVECPGNILGTCNNTIRFPSF